MSLWSTLEKVRQFGQSPWSNSSQVGHRLCAPDMNTILWLVLGAWLTWRIQYCPLASSKVDPLEEYAWTRLSVVALLPGTPTSSAMAAMDRRVRALARWIWGKYLRNS
jgi:hypothetical protein